METKYIKRKCSATNTECYFIPAGNVRSTAGENVHMTLYCKKCGRREDIFLSKEEFFTQQRLIQKEIGDA
jgi:transcription initiation factor IIE alpha subunit